MINILPFIIYCTVWACFIMAGHSWIGIVVGLILMVVTISIIWKIQFGSWKFWEKLK